MKPSLETVRDFAPFRDFLTACVAHDDNTIWTFEGTAPGPTVTVLEATHGNESTALEIVRGLINRALIEGIAAGTLNVGVGNPAAFLAGKRFIDIDLNRCYGEAPVDGYEAELATKRKGLLAATDVLYDIHATIKPSQPFITVANQTPHRHEHTLTTLGIPTMVTGQGLWHPSGQPVYQDTFVAMHGGFGTTIEAGWLGDAQTAHIIAGVIAALEKLGIFKTPDSKRNRQPRTPIIAWDAYWNVIASDDFTWTREWGNFDEIPAGTHFATCNGTPLVTTESSIMLFPKPSKKIVPGQEACIVARARDFTSPLDTAGRKVFEGHHADMVTQGYFRPRTPVELQRACDHHWCMRRGPEMLGGFSVIPSEDTDDDATWHELACMWAQVIGNGLSDRLVAEAQQCLMREEPGGRLFALTQSIPHVFHRNGFIGHGTVQALPRNAFGTTLPSSLSNYTASGRNPEVFTWAPKSL